MAQSDDSHAATTHASAHQQAKASVLVQVVRLIGCIGHRPSASAKVTDIAPRVATFDGETAEQVPGS
jgi:hypothetical protein